jgi:linoleate 10R-lipoxygenase
VELTSKFLDELWNSLQHPPMSYLGNDYKYRSADGSNNSYIFPKLGAANTPYARSVNPRTMQPGALPDPGLIFDSILAREKFIPNPNKVSSIFFAWVRLLRLIEYLLNCSRRVSSFMISSRQITTIMQFPKPAHTST